MPRHTWMALASLTTILLPLQMLAGEPANLKEIMQQLRQNFLDVSDGFLMDDFAKVAEGALAIAEHPRVPETDAQRIADELGAEMPVFTNFDVQVHELSLEMYEAARDGDRVAALEAYQGMVAACVACHTAYRERVGAALNDEH